MESQCIGADGRHRVMIGRKALYDPFWPHHAARALGWDPEFEAWPEQYGWWLTRRAKAMAATA